MSFVIIFGSVLAGVVVGFIFCRLFYSSDVKGSLIITHDGDDPPIMILNLNDYDSIPKFGNVTFEVKHKYPHA